MPSLRKREKPLPVPDDVMIAHEESKTRKQFNVAQKAEYEHEEDMRELPLGKRMVQFCCNPLNRRYRFRPVVHVKSTLVLLFCMSIVFAIIAFTTNVLGDVHYEYCEVEYPSFANDGATDDWIYWDFPWVTPGNTVCDEVDGCYRDDIVHISSNNCKGLLRDFHERNKKKKITGDIKLYYRLDPYYQNHRRYALSRNYAQLLGTSGYDGRDTTVTTTDPMAICTPLETLADLQAQYGIFDDNNDPIPGYPPLAANQKNRDKWGEIVLYPCGLQAFSVFTDEFSVYEYSEPNKNPELRDLGPEIPIYANRDQIVADPDLSFYKNIDGGDTSGVYQWMPKMFDGTAAEGSYLENSHFINWMRLSSQGYAYKLYGTFNATDLETTIELPISIKVRNRYNVSQWGGKKFIILSAQPSLGTISESNFIVLITICVLAMVVVLFLTLKSQLQPRTPGDIKYIGAEYQLKL